MDAFIFPGQGSQDVGMGRVFYDAFPQAREVFEEVDESLKQSLSALIFSGSFEDLSRTENTQPALMTVSMAILRVMTDGKPLSEHVSFVAGHSLGEYTAFCAAEALSLSATATLLRARGQAMQRAVPMGEGAMTAILGLPLEAVEKIVATVSDVGICVVANDNCPGQIVISGVTAAVERAGELALQGGARRIVNLPVSAPSHSPLMQPAADEMERLLHDISVKKAVVPVVTNVTAMPVFDAVNARSLLVAQLTQRVRWRESIENLTKLGVTRFIEIGAGKVLTGLVKRICPDAAVAAINGPDDLDAILT